VYLTPKEQAVYFAALSRGARAVSVRDTAQRLAISKTYAAKLLHDLNRKGVAIRSGKGVYLLADPATVANPRGPSLDPLAALDELMQALGLDYYAAYATAASLHGLYDQVPFAVSVAVPKWRPPRRLGRHRLVFHQIPHDRFWGTMRQAYADAYVTLSDPFKTLLDCSSRLDLVGGASGLIEIVRNAIDAQDAWEPPDADYPNALHGTDAFPDYAGRYGDAAAVQRLGYVLKLVAPEPESPLGRFAASLRPHRGAGVVPLEPQAGKQGRVDGEWGVRDNVASGRLAVA
jgi:predicted transcriptional regulator of viral defense system